MLRKFIVLLVVSAASLPGPLGAQTVKVGLINSYTGFVAQAGDLGQKGIDLYVREHEKDLPPGVKVELLRRDDTSSPEVGKRLAQELISRDHVQLLAGVVLSPVAGAPRHPARFAPVAQQRASLTGAYENRCNGVGPCWRRAAKCSGVL